MRRLGLLALVLALTPAGGPAAAAPADGRIVYRGFATNDLYAVDPDGGNVTRLTFSPGENEQDPVWSPDGTRIAFTGDFGNGDVLTIGADGSGIANLTGDVAVDGEPAWSPDGSRLAFATQRGGVFAIWTMAADGSGQSPLVTTFPASNFEPDWSPDGSRLAFVSNRNGDLELFVASAADGSAQTRLTDHAGLDTSPAWSPDGLRIAFSRADPVTGQRDIAVMDADGTDVALVTDDASADTKPAWSPDGTGLVWERNVGGQSRIVAAAVDGSGLITLTPDSTGASPDWTPVVAPPPPPPPPPASPCIVVGPSTTVDLGTSRFSAPGAAAVVTSPHEVTVRNCGTAPVELAVRATDASGGPATWSLAVVGGDPCATGANRYGLELGALALLTFGRPAGPLAAGATTAQTLRLTMPCGGSAGGGETLGFTIVVTATT